MTAVSTMLETMTVTATATQTMLETSTMLETQTVTSVATGKSLDVLDCTKNSTENIPSSYHDGGVQQHGHPDNA